MTALGRLCRHLDAQGVAYGVHEHREAYTAQEIAALEHVAGRRLAKVVMAFLDGDLAMLVLPAARRVNLGKLSLAAGTQKVRLAHEEEFAPAFPDCDAGAMPPFGDLYGVQVYVDRPLASTGRIVFQAGTHRHTVEMAFADYERLVDPVVADFSDPPA